MSKRERKVFPNKWRESFIIENNRTCNACGREHLRGSKDELFDSLIERGEYYFVYLKQGKEVWRFKDEDKANEYLKYGVAHIDHVVPFSKGGDCSEDNFQLLCALCNLRKSDMSYDAFITKYALCD